MDHDADSQLIHSAWPAMNASLIVRSCLNKAVRTMLVRLVYDKVRADPVLGPIFAAHITDWQPHLARMVEFWSTVALMTGRYHGTAVTKHVGLPTTWAHFKRWRVLFRETAVQVCLPAGAARVIEDAARNNTDPIPKL